MDEDKRFSWRKFEKVKLSRRDLTKQVRKIEKSTLKHARRFVTSRIDRLSLVRRVVFGWAVLIFILAGVSMSQWFGFQRAYTTDAFVAGGAYSEGVLGPLETLNPIFARSSAERSASRLLFASLYTYDSTAHIKGDLAKSISVNDKQTEYTVELHKDLKWSDGAKLDAEDVVFTVDLLKNPEVGAEISGWSSIRAELVDEYRVKFTLPGAYAPFIHAMTFPVLPEHVLADIDPVTLREHKFSSSPVTSGPFALRLLQSASADGSKKVAHMVANPYYHRGAPRLERFQLYAYSSRDEIKQGLKTSEIMATPELIYGGQDERIKDMYASDAYTVNNGIYALFNTKGELTADRSIREALSLSVDRKDIISKLSHAAVELEGPVLGSHASGLPVASARNVERARQILDESGWKISGNLRQKDGQDLTLRMVALQGTGSSQIADQLAKGWQKELNIKVNVEMVDPLDPTQSVLQTVLQPRNFDILIYELVIGGDPDSYAYWHSSQANNNGLNFSNYSNVIVDDALAGARVRNEAAYRAERYRLFVKQWLSDIPAVALYQPKFDYIHSKKIQSLDVDSSLVSAEDRYYDVIYWSVDRGSVFKTP